MVSLLHSCSLSPPSLSLSHTHHPTPFLLSCLKNFHILYWPLFFLLFFIFFLLLLVLYTHWGIMRVCLSVPVCWSAYVYIYTYVSMCKFDFRNFLDGALLYVLSCGLTEHKAKSFKYYSISSHLSGYVPCIDILNTVITSSFQLTCQCWGSEWQSSYLFSNNYIQLALSLASAGPSSCCD